MFLFDLKMSYLLLSFFFFFCSPISKPLKDLVPGRFAYSAKNKTIESLQDLEGITIRSVDPGVTRTYTSVDMLTGDRDVRDSVKYLRSKTWHKRTGARQRAGE